MNKKNIKKIQKVKAMLEHSGNMDETQQCIKHLLSIEEAGIADRSTYEEMNEIEVYLIKEYWISSRVLPNIMEIQI